MLFPFGSCWRPKIPLILYAPDLGSGNWVAGACAITDTGPPVADAAVAPLVATWWACFAFSAALFLTILKLQIHINIDYSKQHTQFLNNFTRINDFFTNIYCIHITIMSTNLSIFVYHFFLLIRD